MLYEPELDETIYQFVARLESLGLMIMINDRSSSSIAYAGNSLMMRQSQHETVYRYHGLTKGAATQMVALLGEKNSTRTIYYHAVGNDGDAVAVGVTTSPRSGALVTPDKDYQAARVGDSEAYVVTLTETVWDAEPVGTDWTTSRPAATGSGVEISRSGSSQYMLTYNNSHNFYSTETVKVTKYSFRTKSEATTLVTNNTVNNASYQKYQYLQSGFYAYALTGTIKTAVMRYIDGDSQYTVEVTERTLGGSWT